VVAVIGAHTDLGLQICKALGADASIGRVVPLAAVGTTERADVNKSATISPVKEVDLLQGDIGAALEGVTQVVHLAPGRSGDLDGTDLDGTGTDGVDVAGTARLLTTMSAQGIDRVVVLSSAMVYGPWPDNPLPLTEAAPRRPHPDLGFALRKADIEQRAEEWQDEDVNRSMCLLRPTVTVSLRPDWLSRSLWNAFGVAAEVEPPVQFLHIDDLVAAVVLAVRTELQGTFNVAPDGWVSGERIRALAGRQARVEVPTKVMERVGALRWITGTTTTPPEVMPYTLEPWVIANDRMRAAGWEATYTNEEAYVSAAPGGPLAMLGSQRRQELALAAVGGVGAATLAAIGGGVAWLRRRS